MARASPARARATASSAVAVPHAAAIRSARANASTQPRFPQPHSGPSGSIVWWPISPAVPSWPWWTRPSIAITPPTPGAERQPDHRGRATAGTEPQLGKAERPRVVDEDRRQADRVADRAGDGLAGPRTGDVDEEPGRSGRRVVQPGHADPDARCRPAAPDRFGRHLAELRDHGRRDVLGGARPAAWPPARERRSPTRHRRARPSPT